MDYLDHLNDDVFEQPVRLRLVGENEDSMLPSYDVGRLLREEYGLAESEYDVALTLNESRAEFAFEGAAVDDVDAAIEDIKALIEQYNTPPEDLPDAKLDEWRQHDASLDAVDRAAQ